MGGVPVLFAEERAWYRLSPMIRRPLGGAVGFLQGEGGVAEPVPNEEIIAAARELIVRRGGAGKEEAAGRVAEFERQARWPEHALAVRVLNAVELLLSQSET